MGDARFWFLAIVIFGGVFALSPSISLAILDFPSLRLGLYQMAAAGLLATSLPLLFTNCQRFLKNRYLIGGFLAIFLAIIIFIAIASIKRLNISFLYKKLPLIIIGTFFGFTLLFLSANIRYSSSPFIAHNTLVSMIDQISLGRIKIPQKTTVKNQPAPATKSSSPHNTPDIKPASPEQTFQPAGFVEASANDRLSASDLAIKSWLNSPRAFFFGVGLGNLGSFIQKHLHVSVPTDQTVYIFYILLLSGLGIIGLLPLIITPFIILFFAIKNLRQTKAQFILSLTVALFIHFWFFGSFINTIHCFAIIGIFLYNYPKDYAEKV